jgi:hypothetical protein
MDKRLPQSAKGESLLVYIARAQLNPLLSPCELVLVPDCYYLSSN